MNIAMILFYPFGKRYNAYSTWSFLANVLLLKTTTVDVPRFPTSEEGEEHFRTVSIVRVIMMR